MCEKKENDVAEEKAVCGFCGSTETTIVYWPGQDGCVWYTVVVCQNCNRKEVL